MAWNIFLILQWFHLRFKEPQCNFEQVRIYVVSLQEIIVEWTTLVPCITSYYSDMSGLWIFGDFKMWKKPHLLPISLSRFSSSLVTFWETPRPLLLVTHLFAISLLFIVPVFELILWAFQPLYSVVLVVMQVIGWLLPRQLDFIWAVWELDYTFLHCLGCTLIQGIRWTYTPLWLRA